MKTRCATVIIASTMFVMLGQTSPAQSRTWVDSDGRKLKAEFVENLHGHVTLKASDGRLLHVSISSLSANDQEYVLGLTPPDIAIDVVEDTDRHNQGFDLGDSNGDRNDDEFQIQSSKDRYKATLTKDSMRSYNGTIRAELYIMGSQSVRSQFVLLNKTVATVAFANESDTFEFTSGNINLTNIEAGSTLGTQYAGYLVVLVDEAGRVFDSKGSRSMFEEHVATIRKKKQGDTIARTDLIPMN
jgi:hypothetical protein